MTADQEYLDVVFQQIGNHVLAKGRRRLLGIHQFLGYRIALPIVVPPLQNIQILRLNGDDGLQIAFVGLARVPQIDAGLTVAGKNHLSFFYESV